MVRGGGWPGHSLSEQPLMRFTHRGSKGRIARSALGGVIPPRGFSIDDWQQYSTGSVPEALLEKRPARSSGPGRSPFAWRAGDGLRLTSGGRRRHVLPGPRFGDLAVGGDLLQK